MTRRHHRPCPVSAGWWTRRFSGPKGVIRRSSGIKWRITRPTCCSNKTAFTLDKEKRDMIFRHNGDMQESDFQLLGYLKLSAAIFPKLFDMFGIETERLLAE
jgi:hypothetical protein